MSVSFHQMFEFSDPENFEIKLTIDHILLIFLAVRVLLSLFESQLVLLLVVFFLRLFGSFLVEVRVALYSDEAQIAY